MIRLTKHITPLAIFQLYGKGRKCKQRCGDCGKPWGETGTDFVSQKETYTKKGDKWGFESETWICDTCADNYE